MDDMDDPSTIQTELTRLVAAHLSKGMSAGSIGLELLTLGIVMLANGESFQRPQIAPSSNRPLERAIQVLVSPGSRKGAKISPSLAALLAA